MTSGRNHPHHRGGATALRPDECKCQKRCYATRADATAGLRLIKASGNKRDYGKVRFAPYRCPNSNVWHLGHASAVNKASRREKRAS